MKRKLGIIIGKSNKSIRVTQHVFLKKRLIRRFQKAAGSCQKKFLTGAGKTFPYSFITAYFIPLAL